MKNLEDMFYDINDLKIVMINKDYIEKQEDDFIQCFNEKVKFIVEKSVISDKDKNGLPYYAEYYTECITEEDLSKRISHRPFQDNPEIFSMVMDIPLDYFTEEEIMTGKISVKRIYKILQDINVNRKIESNKIKVLRERKVNYG